MLYQKRLVQQTLKICYKTTLLKKESQNPFLEIMSERNHLKNSSPFLLLISKVKIQMINKTIAKNKMKAKVEADNLEY